MFNRPTPKDYERELEYLRGEGARTEAFRDLQSRFKNPTDSLSDALRSLHSSAEEGLILDPEKIHNMKTNQPELYREILPVYSDFLREKGEF